MIKAQMCKLPDLLPLATERMSESSGDFSLEGNIELQ